ncbi:MAG TPA: hypothetical protein VJ717_21235 [Gemmatimonadaceae bacterium]|nr:hypothetical protein [Gemmatimonadaceae bacterium]
MATRTTIAAACLTFAMYANVGNAQGTDDTSLLEIAAAKAMLQRSDIPRTRIAIEPGFATAEAAPGHGAIARTARTPTRNSALQAGLKAVRVASLGQLRNCDRCGLTGADVLLTLTDPIIAGALASVTVTALYNGTRGRLEYETVKFTFTRSANSWVVSKIEQLGVS